MRKRLRLLQGLVCFAALWLATTTVSAQWPTVLMFYGPPLKAPIFVTGEDSVAIAPAFQPAPLSPTPPQPTAATVEGRPFISVACFWGPPSNPARNGVENLSDLRPEMANQHARFYLATASQPAAIFSTPILTMKGRDIYGLLTTLPGSDARGDVPASQRKMVAASAPPSSSGYFSSVKPVSASVVAALKKLGVPVGP